MRNAVWGRKLEVRRIGDAHRAGKTETGGEVAGWRGAGGEGGDDRSRPCRTRSRERGSILARAVVGAASSLSSGWHVNSHPRLLIDLSGGPRQASTSAATGLKATWPPAARSQGRGVVGPSWTEEGSLAGERGHRAPVSLPPSEQSWHSSKPLGSN